MKGLFNEDPLCFHCRSALTDVKQTIHLNGLKVKGFVEYNEFFQKMIIQYKECFDEILAPVFLYPYLLDIKRRYRHALFVPAPSFLAKQKERGFSTVQQIFFQTQIEIQECFIKTKNIKQQEQSSEERHLIQAAIQLKRVPDRRSVVLIDDVCTTGSTLLAMHRMLQQEGIESEALVVALHPILLEPQRATGSNKIRQRLESILNTK